MRLALGSHSAAPATLRAVAGAVLGHLLGGLVGVLVVSGPAPRMSTTAGLVLVHLVADLGAGIGAVWGAGVPGGQRVRPVVAVVLVGLLASAVVLAAAGPAPAWLAVRAVLVVVAATVLARRAA